MEPHDTLSTQNMQMVFGLVRSDIFRCKAAALRAGDFELAWVCHKVIDAYRVIENRRLGVGYQGGTADAAGRGR